MLPRILHRQLTLAHAAHAIHTGDRHPVISLLEQLVQLCQHLITSKEAIARHPPILQIRWRPIPSRFRRWH